MVTREEYVQIQRDLVQDLKDGDGHSGRDIAERTDELKGIVTQIAADVANIENRVIPEGAAWDNFQDIQNRLIPEILAQLKALSEKVDKLAK